MPQASLKDNPLSAGDEAGTTAGSPCSYATANQLSKSINSYVPSYFRGGRVINSRSEQCIPGMHPSTPMAARPSSREEGGVEPPSGKRGSMEYQGNGKVHVLLNDRELYIVSLLVRIYDDDWR